MASDALSTRRRTAHVDLTLVYYDGPQLLTLRGKRDSTWIAVAVDKYENYSYPVFCVQISKENLDRYMSGHVDLRYLFFYSKTRDYRVTDLTESGPNGLYLQSINKPPLNWYPDEGFFSRSHTEEVNVGNNTPVARRVLEVAIDGQWDIPDFGAFSERTSECYSFLYSINALKSSATQPARHTRFLKVFKKYPWKGGGSPLNFYNDLYSYLPANDRLAVQKIKYASPGHIEIRGNTDIFDELTTVLGDLSKHYISASDRYRELHQYLAKQKLLSASSIRGTSEQQQAIKRYLDELALVIGFNDTEHVLAYAEGNWVVCAKIILSFFRRLNKLFQFYAEGRASLDQNEKETETTGPL
ncbi:MAG: hypothetical protein POG74_11120 [Acidocella sp.]|nr:hypothetical protein [Acidocella sp.]